MTNNLSLITNRQRKSFTFIELLVVLALVAILSVVVILTLNPAELIKQARDSNRLSDLSTINTALNLFSADVTNGFMGTSTVVYVSIPDNASSTCGSLGLPALPSGYTYKCSTIQDLRNTDGTGWIPVNFQRISSNSPISQLPVDPINTTSTNLYYTYIAGGSWELNANVEAAKNKLGGSGDLVSKDGGSAASQYEIGNNLNLSPLETGDTSLVGYWNFEEGPNATSSDRSGYGNDGTWNGTSTQGEHYVAGKVGNYAGRFNGSSDKVVTNSMSTVDSVGTFSAWMNPSILPQLGGIFDSNYDIFIWANYLYFRSGSNQTPINIDGWASNIWRHVALVWDSSKYYGYVDGELQVTGDRGEPRVGIITLGISDGIFLNGSMDEARVYNRALSAAEVSALYNATK